MTDAAETLRGQFVLLRRIRAEDIDAVVQVLRDPTVARWWGEYSREKVLEEMFDDDAVVYVVEAGGESAGIIQFGEEEDPMYRHASIDIALGEAFQGRGIGPDAIGTLARYLIERRGQHRITIDPAVANHNAITAYERVGFRRVGVMRQYERGQDGTWHDGLLMELLAGELKG